MIPQTHNQKAVFPVKSSKGESENKNIFNDKCKHKFIYYLGHIYMYKMCEKNIIICRWAFTLKQAPYISNGWSLRHLFNLSLIANAISESRNPISEGHT